MNSLWQFVKFGIVGISNTVISEGIYCVLVFFQVPYVMAYFIGFSISVLNAYYWSNKYVFREEKGSAKRVWWKVFLKTYAAYFWGFLVSALLLVFWIDIVQIARYLGGLEKVCLEMGFEGLDADTLGEMLAAGINLLITVPMNFLVNKFWAYRER